MKLYTIYDRVAEEAAPPFVARTDGVAVRNYLYAIENSKLDIQDYWLYEVGGWNPEEMLITPISKPLRVKVSQGDLEVVSSEER